MPKIESEYGGPCADLEAAPLNGNVASPNANSSLNSSQNIEMSDIASGSESRLPRKERIEMAL